MSEQLPQRVDALRLAESGRRLRGSLALEQLPRLGALLRNPSGCVSLDLEFARDEQGQACVNGGVWGQLQMTCQRCLGSITVAVHTDVSLDIVTSEAEWMRRGGAREPLIVGQEPTALADLVEDELLLAIPQIPMHPDGLCHAEIDSAPADGVTSAENPFAVLAGFKARGKGG